jgi:hypothetical protein
MFELLDLLCTGSRPRRIEGWSTGVASVASYRPTIPTIPSTRHPLRRERQPPAEPSVSRHGQTAAWSVEPEHCHAIKIAYDDDLSYAGVAVFKPMARAASIIRSS